MKVPAWEFWSNDHSWGVRELDTRKLREGASIEEAYSNTVWHIDMGCLPEKSDGNDAKIVGGWLKDWAWQVGIPMLLSRYGTLLHRNRPVIFAVSTRARGWSDE